MTPIRRSTSPAALARLVVLCATLAAAAGYAHEKDAPAAGATRRISSPAPQAVTIRGELIDPQCYFTHASRGPEHAACARMCAKGGQDLAFLHEASGVVYPLVAKGHGKNPNEGLIDHVGKSVQIKGTIYRVGSNAVLVLESVSDV